MNTFLYSPATWRLLISPPADGATNMATDEAIVRAVAAGLAPSTLRLYSWEPPCLSLGRGQAGDEVDRAACARDGVDVVRRPTGGRAILHADELTYSVIAPPDDPRLTGDIVTSYRRLSRALLATLQHLGVDASTQHPIPNTQYPIPNTQYASHSATLRGLETRNTNPVCFEVPSHYELTTADGRKLIGSAQMRSSAVLQHGTLPLVGDVARICRYLVDAPDPDRVRARAATLESASGRPVGWEEAAEAMVAGFSAALNLTLSPGQLTPEEGDWIAELRADKYASDAWTWRL